MGTPEQSRRDFICVARDFNHFNPGRGGGFRISVISWAGGPAPQSRAGAHVRTDAVSANADERRCPPTPSPSRRELRSLARARGARAPLAETVTAARGYGARQYLLISSTSGSSPFTTASSAPSAALRRVAFRSAAASASSRSALAISRAIFW